MERGGPASGTGSCPRLSREPSQGRAPRGATHQGRDAGGTVTRPPRPLLEHGLSRLCVWKMDACQTPRLWRYLGATVGPSVERIRKVERVIQRDGAVRFDLYMGEDDVAVVQPAMVAATRRMGWYVRPHRPREGPPPRRGERDGRERNEGGQVAVWSYNIATLSRKRQDLGYLAAQEGVGILALQETRRMSEQWRFRLTGYNSLESTASRTEAGRHGLALLVREDIGMYEVGDESGWWVFARLFGGPLATPWVVGTFYRPHAREAGREAWRGLRRQLVRLRQKHPADPILVVGDWNCRREALAKRLERWRLGMVLASVRGSPRSFSRGQHGDIDHMVISAEHVHLLGDVKVMRGWDLADHWPVCAAIDGRRNPLAAGVGEPREVMRGLPYRPGPKSAEQKEEQTQQWLGIQSSNYWAPLLELVEHEEGEGEAEPPALAAETLDAAAQTFTDTSFQLAREMGLTADVDPGVKVRKPLVSAGHRRTVRKRLRAYRRVREAEGAQEREEAQQAYVDARADARRSARKEARARWHASLAKGAAQLTEEPRAFWRWASDLGGWKLKAAARGLQPIRDEHGKLLTDAEEIGGAWARHYQRLADDPTGHSQDAEHWRPLTEDWGMPHLGELDEPISKEELYRAALHLKSNKAPGEDGIPAEWLKKLLPPALATAGGAAAMGQEGWEERYEGVEGPSHLARVMLALLNQVWQTQHIPACWRRAWLVSIYKGKGDALEMDNYRGISLMAVPLKMLLVILARRLEGTLSERGLLAREQAGFRAGEECVGQAAALLEVLQRRRVRGRRTYAMFVDLSKAYDVVPHGALFAKMDQLGVRGRMLDFVRSLYASSELQVRMPLGTSPVIRLKRGVRQGCPLSPILFDIFINDVYGLPGEPRERLGVRVPGVPEVEGLMAGLLFADDLVALSSSRRSLQRQADRVSEWCATWEMKVGIQKCGVMCVEPTGREGGQERLQEAPIRISGQDVPVVEEYTYLGLTFRRDLDLEVMLHGRLAKAKRAWGMMRPFLSTASVPLAARVAVLRSVILATLLYGAELWGMQQQRTQKAQTWLNRVLRVVAGAKETDTSLPVGALWREMGVAPVHAQAAARRARAINKFRHLQTWIAVLLEHPARQRRRTWVSGALQWMRRFHPDVLWENEYAVGGATEGVPGRRAHARVLEQTWLRMEERSSMWASRGYRRRRYSETVWAAPGVVPAWARRAQPPLGFGLRALHRCRLGGVWTAQRLAQRGLLDEQYVSRCPCCGRGRAETLCHLLLSCPRWREQREIYLGVLLSKIEKLRLSRSRRAALLLGGEYRGHRLRGWLPAKVADPEVASGVGYRMCDAFRVAAYLQRVLKVRQSILGPLRRAAVPLLNQGPPG